MKPVVVLVTVPDPATGRRIGRRLVTQRLSACVSMTQAIESTYRWNGKLERSSERLLIIKTLDTFFKRLEAAVKKEHPYEVPEVLAIPVTRGSREYLKWLESSLR